MISSTNGMASRVSALEELRQKQDYYERVAKEGGFSCDQSPPTAFISETQKLRFALATIRSVIATQRSGMSDLSVINLQEVCLDIADMIAGRAK